MAVGSVSSGLYLILVFSLHKLFSIRIFKYSPMHLSQRGETVNTTSHFLINCDYNYSFILFASLFILKSPTNKNQQIIHLGAERTYPTINPKQYLKTNKQKCV